MYKNFKITEEEKKKIMEMHKNHGYKKPLNEQSVDNDEETEDNEMSVDSLVFFEISKFKIYVSTEDGGDETILALTTDGDSNVIDIEMDTNMSEIYSDEQIIEFVRKKVDEGLFNNVPHHISFDMNKGEIFDFE